MATHENSNSKVQGKRLSKPERRRAIVGTSEITQKTIGEVANEVGVATTALRFYEREGILIPSARSAKGYRLYSEGDVHRLEFIRGAQAIGFALEDIRTLLAIDEKTSCKKVQSMIQARVSDIDRKLADLRRVRATLSSALDQCKRSNKSCPVVSQLKGRRGVRN